MLEEIVTHLLDIHGTAMAKKEQRMQETAANRNFSIDAYDVQGGLHLTITNGEEEVDLGNAFVPELELVDSKAFQYTHDAATLEVDCSSMRSPYFLPVLLHEIGHAKVYEEEFAALCARLSTGRYSDLELSEQYEARSERRAWAYALRQMRTLNNAGFNVFADCPRRKLRSFIQTALVTHEIEYLGKRLEHDGRIRNEPLFTNKPIIQVEYA